MKRIVAATLLCLLLTACGHTAPQQAPSLLGQAAGLDENETLLTVDGCPVPAWRYLYWLAKDCALLEARYAEAGETLDWTAPGPDGETPEARVKAAALSDTVLCTVVETWAARYDCALTEAGSAALPEGADPYLTAEQSRELAVLGQQYSALSQLCQTAGSPLFPTEEALAAFARTAGLLEAEQLPIPWNGDREAARQRAATLFAQINRAEDPDAVFAALLVENGGGAMSAADWTDALLDAAVPLEAGQLSGILETETGFCILRRLPTDWTALREAYFDALLLDTAAQCTVGPTPALDALCAATFHASLKGTMDPQ